MLRLTQPISWEWLMTCAATRIFHSRITFHLHLGLLLLLPLTSSPTPNPKAYYPHVFGRKH